LTTDTAAQHLAQRKRDGEACRQAAFGYLARGWSALALCTPDHVAVGKTHLKHCKNPGKAPWGEWKEFQTRLPTEEELRRKWRDNGQLNVGMALGPVSGVVRLDVEGEAARNQLQDISGGDLPPTLEFKSGRADGTGRGILYTIPPGVIFRTTPQFFQDGELRFQAQGAQSVLPPSRHKDGGLYQWLPGRGPEEISLALAPQWAVRRWSAGPDGLRRERPSVPSESGTANPSDVALTVEALRHLGPWRAGRYDTWLKVGMVLHSVSDDAEMLNTWDHWSRQCAEQYEPGVCAVKWATFQAAGELRLRHLLRWAEKDSGWVPPTGPLVRWRRPGRKGRHALIRFTVEVG
jgi:hypothetical protein